MGVLVTKEDDDNIELTNKINADLREKMSRTQNPDEEDPNLADAEYLEDYRPTGRFTWIWIVLIALAVASVIYIVLT